jgi:hypothetical protein
MRRDVREPTRPRDRDESSRRAMRYLEHHRGEPLAPAVRAAAEPRFGHNFADVRVHNGAQAESLAASVGATAFTVGQDLVFGRGAYDPESPDGLGLILHELTHAVQNEWAGPPATLGSVSEPGDASEVEAAAVAAGLTDPGAVHGAPTAAIAREATGSDPMKKVGDVGGALSKGSSFAESWYGGLLERDWWKPMEDSTKYVKRLDTRLGREKTFGTLGDAFGLGGGMFDTMSGVYRLANGGGASAGLDTAKGALDAVSGFGGLMGNPLVDGYAGMGSASIDVARGLYTAISSDDVGEATEGAYQTAGGIASGIASFGDATKNPVAMATGRALGLGLAAGEGIVSNSDRISRERGYFEDDAGTSQSGSSEAADWGRSVDEAFGHDNWLLDKVGGVAGGIVAAGGGIANSAYTYGHRAVDAIGDFFSSDGPSMWELMDQKKREMQMAKDGASVTDTVLKAMDAQMRRSP